MGGQLFSKPQFGRDYVYGNNNPNFTTTSTTFQTALEVQILNATAGRYRIAWSYRSRNSKSNTNNQTEVGFGTGGPTGAVVTNSVSGQALSLGGGLGEQFGGFYEFTIVDVAVLNGEISIRRSAGNGTAWVNTMNLEMYKVD